MLRLGLTAQIFFNFLYCTVLAQTDLDLLLSAQQLRPTLVAKVYLKKDPATHTWTFQDEDFANQVMASQYTPGSQFQLVKGVRTFPDLSYVGVHWDSSNANFWVRDSTMEPILYVAEGKDVYVHFHGANETSNFIAGPTRKSYQPALLSYNVPLKENEIILEASSGRQKKWAAAIVYQAIAIRTPPPPEQEEQWFRSGSNVDLSDNVENNTKIVISIRTIFPASSNPNKKRHTWKSEHTLYTSPDNWRQIFQVIRGKLLDATEMLILDAEQSSLKKEHEFKIIDAELNRIRTGANSWSSIFMSALVLIPAVMVAVSLIANNDALALQVLIEKLFLTSVIMLISTGVIVLMGKVVVEIVRGNLL